MVLVWKSRHELISGFVFEAYCIIVIIITEHAYFIFYIIVIIILYGALLNASFCNKMPFI